DSPFYLEAFSDSDYAGASLDRKSTTRGCQFLGKRLISWQCKKQNVVANSTTKAEYVFAASCCGQAYTYYCQRKVNADGKKIIITEASIRRDLRLDDAEGTACLPNAAIFEELARMGAKTTAWNEFSSTMASAIICLANNQKFNFSKCILDKMRKHKSRRKQRKETEVPHTKPQTKAHIPTPSHDPLPSGKDKMLLSKLMEICTKFSDGVLSLDKIKINQVVEIKKLKKIVKKLKGKKKKRTHGLKRLYKERIAAIDVDEDLSLINETAQDQGRMNDEDLFGVSDLDDDEVILDVTTSENVEQNATVAKKEVSVATDEVVITAKSVAGITTAITPQISKDDVTLVHTLIEIKSAKPRASGVIIQEPSEFRTTSPSQPSLPPQPKDKGKGIMVELEKPLKKKDQIELDEEVARKLEAKMKAKMDEEERIAKENNEANRAVIEEWDDVQAIIDADRQLAEQLQAQEREQLSIKERSKLLAKLIESRRKYFTAKRAEEIRNKPPTKA
nr:putative ribonuclease H-like domain-containing protein [Tanacetum cinerariifolium]